MGHEPERPYAAERVGTRAAGGPAPPFTSSNTDRDHQLPLDFAALAGASTPETAVGYENQVRYRQAGSRAGESSGMESPKEFYRRRREVIAENLVERCEDSGTSQGQLARLVGVDHRMVWDWVHAVHAPSDRYLRRLEKALDVPMGYLTTEHGKENAA